MREREEFFKTFDEEGEPSANEEEFIIEGKIKTEVRTVDGRLYEEVMHQKVEEQPAIQREQFDFSKVSDSTLEELEWLKPQLLQMLPFRHAAIKEELLKYKNKREKLLLLLDTIEESELFIERVLQNQYVGIFERYPDLAQVFIDLVKRDEIALNRVTRRIGKREAILGPEGVKLDQKLIESNSEGKGTEMTTSIDYNPKKLLAIKPKREKLKDVKKKFDHK